MAKHKTKIKKEKLWTAHNYFDTGLPDYIYFGSWRDGDKFIRTHLDTKRVEYMRYKQESNPDGTVSHLEYTMPPFSGMAKLYFRLSQGYFDKKDETYR